MVFQRYGPHGQCSVSTYLGFNVPPLDTALRRSTPFHRSTTAPSTSITTSLLRPPPLRTICRYLWTPVASRPSSSSASTSPSSSGHASYPQAADSNPGFGLTATAHWSGLWQRPVVIAMPCCRLRIPGAKRCCRSYRLGSKRAREGSCPSGGSHTAALSVGFGHRFNVVWRSRSPGEALSPKRLCEVRARFERPLPALLRKCQEAACLLLEPTMLPRQQTATGTGGCEVRWVCTWRAVWVCGLVLSSVPWRQFEGPGAW